jgi:hypothetical protein
MIDPNNSELVRKLTGLHQMIECRDYETLGQIPTCAENYQGCGLWLTTPQDLCHSFCAFGWGSCDRTHGPNLIKTGLSGRFSFTSAFVAVPPPALDLPG